MSVSIYPYYNVNRNAYNNTETNTRLLLTSEGRYDCLTQVPFVVPTYRIGQLPTEGQYLMTNPLPFKVTTRFNSV